ncbi:probable glutamate receptor [Cherax quadricarinatus]|uniref:probable glutamate receptor n=1 Tax=Cherax quadricarinatus TaxID=27406 RepID=UPI00387E7DF3
MSELLEIFADKMNFSYELVRPSDLMWGGPQTDGSWTGMLGMLQRLEVEFAIGPFGVTDLRETVCDFSEPVHSENNAILMVRPTLQNDVSGFLKPFAFEVWLLMLLSLVSVVGAVTLLTDNTLAEDKIYSFDSRNTLVKAAMWSLKALTQESSVWLPKSRLIVITWLLVSYVFASSYSGILTAMLTVPQVSIPIDSLADLVAQSHLPWRLETGSMMFQYFKESNDEVLLKVFRGVSGTFPDCWAAREDVANGKFAAICDKTTMKKAMSWDFSTSGKCHLYISKEKVYSNALIAMAFKINSTYLAPANHIISLMKESGILYKWLGDQITNTSQCLRPPTSDRGEGIAPLNIEVVEGPFLLLAGGLTVSLIAFLSELTVWYSCGGNHKSPRNA